MGNMPGLPPHGRAYEVFFETSAYEFKLDPYLLAAICEQESLFGDALTPEGPGGTGDFGQRHASRVGGNVPVLSSAEYVRPVDGLGWGRGLMQLDWAGHPEIWASDIWKVASWNIHAGAWAFYKNLLALKGDEYLALLAYNSGEPFIEHVLDRVTVSDKDQLHHVASRYAPHNLEGLDYAQQVLERRDKFNATKKGA